MPASGGRFTRLGVPGVEQLCSFGADTSRELYAVSLAGAVLEFVSES